MAAIPGSVSLHPFTLLVHDELMLDSPPKVPAAVVLEARSARARA